MSRNGRKSPAWPPKGRRRAKHGPNITKTTRRSEKAEMFGQSPHTARKLPKQADNHQNSEKLTETAGKSLKDPETHRNIQKITVPTHLTCLWLTITWLSLARGRLIQTLRLAEGMHDRKRGVERHGRPRAGPPFELHHGQHCRWPYAGRSPCCRPPSRRRVRAATRGSPAIDSHDAT